MGRARLLACLLSHTWVPHSFSFLTQAMQTRMGFLHNHRTVVIWRFSHWKWSMLLDHLNIGPLVHWPIGLTWAKILDNKIYRYEKLLKLHYLYRYSPDCSPYISSKISSMNLIKDQSIFALVIILLILISLSSWWCLDSVRRKLMLVTLELRLHLRKSMWILCDTSTWWSLRDAW